MTEEYKEIKPDLLKVICNNAWSAENMAAHGAGERSLTYIGSRTENHIVYDYYKDSTGAYWFKNRAMLPSGAIVSMELYIFGRELKERNIKRKTK